MDTLNAEYEVSEGRSFFRRSATAVTIHRVRFRDRSIEKAIDEIGGELHSQYSLSYTPTGTRASGYHEIKVSVDRPGVKVRARPGYYLAPEG